MSRTTATERLLDALPTSHKAVRIGTETAQSRTAALLTVAVTFPGSTVDSANGLEQAAWWCGRLWGRREGRAVVGFGIAIAIGSVIGALVSRSKVLRSGIGSMITGLQTMPSVAWFPAAILLFKQTEATILFVVVIGAAPAIANGLIAGVDHVPPILVRAGHVLGARRFGLFRFVIAPAALPAYVTGLKQGWAFAWRSLMAGELLVQVAGALTLGQQLQYNESFNDATGIYAVMVVIFVIGVLVDAVVFGNLERFIQRRYGLAGAND